MAVNSSFVYTLAKLVMYKCSDMQKIGFSFAYCEKLSNFVVDILYHSPNVKLLERTLWA